MRTSELIARAGVKKTDFNNWSHFGSLPFEPVKKSGWREWDEGAVTQLNLMAQFAALGIGPSVCKPIIERGNGDAEKILALFRGQS